VGIGKRASFQTSFHRLQTERFGAEPDTLVTRSLPTVSWVHIYVPTHYSTLPLHHIPFHTMPSSSTSTISKKVRFQGLNEGEKSDQEGAESTTVEGETSSVQSSQEPSKAFTPESGTSSSMKSSTSSLGHTISSYPHVIRPAAHIGPRMTCTGQKKRCKSNGEVTSYFGSVVNFFTGSTGGKST
jgi:hypothetical protein